MSAPDHQRLNNLDYGTRVSVHDLFGNIPVRVKQRPGVETNGKIFDKDWSALRKVIIGTFLAWGSYVSITLRTISNSHQINLKTPKRLPGSSASAIDHTAATESFDVKVISNILIQGDHIGSQGWDSWQQISARSSTVTIRAAICLYGAPSRYCQFISVGKQFISPEAGSCVLYDEVNRLFARSSFGTPETSCDEYSRPRRVVRDNEQCRSTRVRDGERKNSSKGVDRWPKYYIRIDLSDAELIHRLNVSRWPETQYGLNSIIEILTSLIESFLNEHHFRPRRLSSKNPCVLHRATNDDSPAPHRRRVIEGHPNVTPSTANMGPKLQIPNFSRGRSTYSGSAFVNWSRIKRAKRDFTSCLVPLSGTSIPRKPELSAGRLLDTEADPEVERNCPCKQTKLIRGVEAHESDREISQAYSRSDAGSLACHRFNDQGTEASSDEEPLDKADSTVTWTNPVSKEKVKLNARTGILIPRIRHQQTWYNPESDTSTPSSGMLTAPLIGRFGSHDRNLERTSVNMAGTWVDNFLKRWKNPVFGETEDQVPQISMCDQGTEGSSISNRAWTHSGLSRAFLEPSRLSMARFSRSDLKTAKLIAQLDKKFLLLVIQTSTRESDQGFRVVTLVDQHAADERVRVEALMSDLCRTPSPGAELLQSAFGLKSAIETVKMSKPIVYHVSAREHALFERYAAHFAEWGILYDLEVASQHVSYAKPDDPFNVVVSTLPPGIAERCRADPKGLREMMRKEIWKIEDPGIAYSKTSRSTHHEVAVSENNTDNLDSRSSNNDWLQRIRTCPQGILDMLNSRSCRSAVMFNDVLSSSECEELVSRLAECHLPFQCAHGRPSMIPVVNIGAPMACVDENRSGFQLDLKKPTADNIPFEQAWRSWKHE